ncbi:hypothetical protein PPSIR1_16855 [Plesiocystis pacifica SIR-1]|uniref:Lipoprotein n=1 Tax=Plesiocystis pacifica SIR-1 TaxID=391625 RepID=A6GJA1_9BACT|nr:hypothetical protein [Plesiocystis pacifica]EDM74046.1 hypothetical protein PPSIR1_16855 [Plesiocystis pacifica SIR-1]
MKHNAIRLLSVLTLGLASATSMVACDAEEGEDYEMLQLDEDEEEQAFRAGNYYVPVGTHDAANCNNIAGWVKDGDTTAATWVSIHRDAPYPNGTEVAVVKADKYRADLPWADKNHGFNISTPNSLKNGQHVTLYVHGINVDANGNWDVNALSPLLNNTGKTICCGQGCFDGPGDGGDFIPPM